MNDYDYLCDHCTHEFDYEDAIRQYFLNDEIILCPICRELIDLDN